MTHPNPATAMAWALVDEMSRGGAGLVVVSPGSRSAALAIAAADHPDLETKVVLDERSAGFYALGRAKATGRPALVVSTSGTAPANYLPAVVEADMSLAPLIVVSADRPAALRGVGANQTIDQRRLFGDKVRRFFDLPAPVATVDQSGEWRSVAAEAVARSHGWGGRPGPVHINAGFAEPTVPVSDDGRSVAKPYPFPTTGRAGGLPWAEWPIPPAPPPPSIESPARRPLIVAGEGIPDPESLAGEASRRGWPVLATALSGMRGRPGVVTRYHHLLAAGVPEALAPDLVLATGALGPSSRLDELVTVASWRMRVDRWGRRIDPRRDSTHLIWADPTETLERITCPDPEPGWARSWADADAAAAGAIAADLSQWPGPTGGAVVAALDGSEAWRTMVVGSSLPIREVDAHLVSGRRVVANRGASGIDGIVSTARGAAQAGTVALVGDLSLLHDQNGLLPEVTEDLVLVVLDNGGGGLFDSLPQSEHAPHYERLFVTPPHRDLELVARFNELPFAEAGSAEEVASAVEAAVEAGGLHMVRVPVDRSTDLLARRSLDAAGAKLASGL